MLLPTTELDIYVGNFTIIDREVFDLWVAGYSVTDAVGVMQQKGVLETWGATYALLMADVTNDYRTFGMLEKLLLNPIKLAEEWTFQLHPSVQKLVIEKYYSFDDKVIREILGKKLSGRTRKDLDDVADKTAISLRSCRRQFDNVKRIYKLMDDISGSVEQNIQTHFLLPPNLAQKYAAIVFLMSNRFETSKRRLNFVTCEDFCKSATAMMNNWTSSLTGPRRSESLDGCDLEREFLVQLRDLKAFVDKEKEHRNITLTNLKGKVPDRMRLEVEGNFKTYSRTLINIATSLINSKSQRDFFLDLVEKFVDVAKQARWKPEELESFLKVYTEAGSSLDMGLNDASLRITWERYMNVVQICIKQLFHS